MKIEPRKVQHVVANIGNWRAVLLHGEDHGLIRERAAMIAAQIVPDRNDPFRAVILDRESQARLEEEATALSLIGGRRVVWARDVSDNVCSLVEAALSTSTDTLILMEAPGLAARSKLRTAMEKRADVAVIACYADEGRSLEMTVRSLFDAAGVRLQPDAQRWLINALASDRALVRQEVEKLILYAEPPVPLSLDDVQLCIGDTRGETLGNATSFALAGERALADEAIERAIADGAVPVAIARACASALLRVATVRDAMDHGATSADAEKTLRPPLFFKVAERFRTAVRRWDMASLNRAGAATFALEFECKQTGTPDLALVRRHIAKLCAGPRAFKDDATRTKKTT